MMGIGNYRLPTTTEDAMARSSLPNPDAAHAQPTAPACPWPSSGGTYQRDPKTGALTLLEAPSEAQYVPPCLAAAPVAPDAQDPEAAAP